MIARSPVAGSLQKTTCSWSSQNTSLDVSSPRLLVAALTVSLVTVWTSLAGPALVGRGSRPAAPPLAPVSATLGRPRWAARWHPGPVPPTARRPPYVTHLRVLEPVAHLPRQARDRWLRYADGRPGRRELEGAAFTDSVRRLAARPPVPLPPGERREGLLVEVAGEL